MKRTLQLIAILLATGSLAVWLATGSNRGWTRTSVEIQKTDEVTGLSYRVYKKRFVPGVDLLAAGLAGSGFVAGASLLLRRRSLPTTT